MTYIKQKRLLFQFSGKTNSVNSVRHALFADEKPAEDLKKNICGDLI